MEESEIGSALEGHTEMEASVVAVPSIEAMDEEDDEDDILNAKKRKRDEVDENFEFKLLAPEGIDETSPIDVRSKFIRMFFETKLHPTKERNLNMEVQESLEKRVERKKRVTTAGEREKQRRAAVRVAKENEEIQKLLEETNQPVAELTEEDHAEIERAERQMAAREREEEEQEGDADKNLNMKAALGFFGHSFDDDMEEKEERDAEYYEKQMELEKEEEAFKEIATAKKSKVKLGEVIPPEDMKRLYLRDNDKTIVGKDLPERYQLMLDSVGWTQETITETFFGSNQDPLQWMVNYIYSKLFRNTAHTPQIIEQVLTYIFKYGNEPVFIQRYCMLRQNADESVTLDDVWAVWNAAFEFISIYNRREDLKERLYPVHEAFIEGLYSDQLGNPKYPTSNYEQRVNMAQRIVEGFESVSFDMYNVSFAELSTKGTQARWTWEPHYLTWVEKWMTHWDEVFQRVCTSMNTQIAYNMRLDGNKINRIPLKRNDAVRYRSQNLFHFALQFSAHPSTLAMSLTSSANEDYTRALLGQVTIGDLEPDEQNRVMGVQHMTRTKPSHRPAVCFEHWLTTANTMHGGMWGTGPEGANRLKLACVDMLAGSLSAEPRFRQTLLNLLIGFEDQSVMSLGRIRVQPSTTGFGYFKQGGQTRVGYRNLCLNSRKFTSELKEELVKYIESGLMVYWFEVDDPAKIKREIEDELFRTEGQTESQSISASSQGASTTMTAMTAMTQQLEVNRLNAKRETLTSSVNISDLDIWYPSEQTFEQFKQKIKKRKTEVLTSVLRDAHREQGNVNITKLPFVPFDEWYTERPQVDGEMTEQQKLASEWSDVRVSVLEKAVFMALDDVEEILWDKIASEVKEKILSDSAAGLRKMVLRAGYQSYKLKSGVTEDMDAAAQRMLLDEEMFTSNEPTDFVLDPSDLTTPGRYRVAGVVYDDVMKQHTICFLDEFGNYLDSFELQHLVMREEDSLVREKLDDMQVRLRKCIFTFRPQAWAIGMTHATDLKVREMLRKFNVDWQAMLQDRELANLLPKGFKPPKIEMVDARIARVWARSREATTELRDLDESRRKAVAVGRTLRSPLSSVASLFTADKDALSLALSEMQDIVPRLGLLRRMEQQMVSIIAVVGLDINHVLNGVARSEHGLLQFLPGFGPRKAAYLYRAIAKDHPFIDDREKLRLLPFYLEKGGLEAQKMGDVVYRNAAGFVKVLMALPEVLRDGKDTHEKERGLGRKYKFTLDRTRIHPSFYPWVTVIVQSIGVGLGIVDVDSLARLSEKQYHKVMVRKAEEMMIDAEERRQAGHPEEADLLQVQWGGMKDEWKQMYNSAADYIEDDMERELFASVPVADIMQVIREELLHPYEIRADPEDELNSMAEYRPMHDDVVFDTVVDDTTITPGALRIINVMTTTPTGIRASISGCDAARGSIVRAETKPGAQYTEQDWVLYRDQWFKKGMQFEAVITKVVKTSFLVMLSIDVDKVKEAKMKVDKHYKEMEKALRAKENQAAGRLSATASQTGTIETMSQTGTQVTFPFTESHTMTSAIDSQLDNRHGGGDKPQWHVPEGEGGALLSHPLYIPSIETQPQVRAKLLETDKSTGRDFYKPGDLLMRPDIRSKSKTHFKLEMRMHDYPLVDEKNLFGLGYGKELRRTAFLSIGFEVKTSGVSVTEHRPDYRPVPGEEQNPEEALHTLYYDDVDHMISVHAKKWFRQTLEVRRHEHWDDRVPQVVRKWVASEAVSRSRSRGKDGRHTTPWKICSDDASISENLQGGMPVVKMNAMRFLVVFPGLTSQERAQKKTRMFLFEARRDHYRLIRACSSKIRFTGRGLNDLNECLKFAQHHYMRLSSSSASSRRVSEREVSPSLDGRN